MFCCSTKLLIFNSCWTSAVSSCGFQRRRILEVSKRGCDGRTSSERKSFKLTSRLDYTSIAHFQVSVRNIGGDTANLIHPGQKVIQDLRKTAPRLPTQLHQPINAGDAVSVVPDPVLTGNDAAGFFPRFSSYQLHIFQDRGRRAASYVECLKVCVLVGKHRKISLHQVINVHKISCLAAVFVDDQRLSSECSSGEDTQDPGILVKQRLPWTLRDGVAQGYGRDLVDAPQTQGH